MTSEAARRRARVVTAAAQRIDVRTRDGKKLVRSAEGWQGEAWEFLDSLPEIKFAAGFMGNSMSRVRFFPGVIEDPDEPAVALADADGIPADMADVADDEMARIGNGHDGWPGVLRSLGVCLTVAGEAYLVGRPLEDDPFADEQWGVYSSSAIEVKSNTVRIKEGGPRDKGIELPDDALVYRIWRRHPRYPGLADSNMRAVLDAAEELVLWGKRLRSIAKSGTNAGAYWLPDELDFANQPKPADATAGDDSEMTPLEQSLIDALVRPIEDDGSAAAVAPFIGRGAGDWIEKIRFDSFTRNLDDKTVERIEHLIRRLAHGLDLPVEILTGIASSNHWSSWLVDDITYRAHIEPTASVPAAGIASAFLRPALLEAGFPIDQVRRVVLGIDPSALVIRPNRGADARDAYAAGEITGDALRRYLGMADADAPDDEERIRRYAMDRGIGGQDLTAILMNRTVTEDDPIPLPSEIAAAAAQGAEGEGGAVGPTAPDTPAEEGGDPVPDTLPAATRPLALAPALTAAAEPEEADEDPWALLALALARIETALFARLTVAASDDVNDALRVAGNRLRSAVQHNAEARERVRGVAPEDVASALGPALVAELADMGRLLDGSLGALEGRWQTWVGAAQGQAAGLLDRAIPVAPDPAAAEEALNAFRLRAEANRAAGWDVLAGQLRELLESRLRSMAADLAEGEADPTSSVPAGTVRDALARAGGGAVGFMPTGEAQHAGPAGLTTGPEVRALLDALGAVVLAWRWDAGAPARPFPPHQRLDGVTFDRWDDPQLTNGGAWPGVSHFAPGDHRGCSCSATPVIVQPDGTTPQRPPPAQLPVAAAANPAQRLRR